MIEVIWRYDPASKITETQPQTPAEARARLATLEGVSDVEIAQSRRCNWCGAPSEGLECGAC